ncbi:MAG: 50S ribosomal protein L31 [Bdellovibrionales bacterium]|jgi:large subunit ribosomal protein L31
MKKDIHPEYHDISIIMTDGTEFTTRSTYGKAGDHIQLDIDAKTHPAWTGQFRMVDRGGQLAKFNKRFAGLGTKKGEGEVAAAPAAAAPVAKEDKIKLTTKATPAAAKAKAPAKAKKA